jgi:hypothetical protein
MYLMLLNWTDQGIKNVVLLLPEWVISA